MMDLQVHKQERDGVIQAMTAALQQYAASDGSVNNQRVEIGGELFKVRVSVTDREISVSLIHRGSAV